uniref:RING-type domain-containing protein n=1 Tax=Meloidogyne javanica TaxID=6303 RepID=A0A915MU47_MELJA
MSSNSGALRNSLNNLENAMEIRISNHHNDMNGDCFCKQPLNFPIAFMECCYTFAHKKCLLDFVSYCERCPCMDCLQKAKKEDVKDFIPPEINPLQENNSTNNVYLADTKMISNLIGFFNDSFTARPSISGGTAGSTNMKVDTFKQSKLRLLIRFLDTNKVPIVVLAVALVIVCVLFSECGIWPVIFVFIRQSFMALKENAPALAAAVMAFIRTDFEKKNLEF